MADEALDNLGRKVDTANMSIGELKGLIASLMKSKVGAAKPVNEKKDDPAKKLTTLFEKYTKDFEKETKEQKGLLQKIVDGFKEMKSKKSGGKASDGKASFSERANKSLGKGLKASKEDQTTAKSTKSLENIFAKKGSGYTHDVYCEKYLREIYSVLVKIAETKGISVPTAVPKKAPEEELKRGGDVGPTAVPKDRTTVETEEAEIEARRKNYTKRQLRDWRNLSNAVKNYNKEQKKPWKNIEVAANSLNDIFKMEENQRRQWIAHEASKESVMSHIANLEGKNIEHLIKLSKSKEKLVAETAQEELRDLERKAEEHKKDEKRILKNQQIQKQNWETLKSAAKYLEETVLGIRTFETIFKGVVNEERKFTQDIRQAAYETAGVTKESQSLQKSFEQIGKTVKLTGFDRSEFQKEYIKNLKSGVKDQKKAVALTTSQLNTEKQIGVEAGSLGDTFVMLNNQLKLSDDQISEVGRGIREVGRNTGLVGSELAGVVNSSKQFVDQMRKAGSATASSISNVIALQAEFKKLGVEDVGSKVLSAISSTTGFYEAGVQTQSLIANAASKVGLDFDMTTGGIVKSNEKLKLLNKGLIKTANSLGLGGSNLEEMRKNFENMSDDAKKKINLTFKGAFGMEAGEALGTIEAFENKTKTLSEKLSDLNKEKSKNLTLEERATLAEKERSLKLSAGLKALTALSEAAIDVTSMDQALAKFGKRRSEFEGDIKALGGAWTSETGAARTAIESSVNELNKGLKGAGKKGLAIDSARIEKALKDPAALRELTEEINKGEKELATAQKAQNDPLTSMDQTLKEINDNIRNMSQGIISAIFNSPFGGALLKLIAVLGFLISAISIFQVGIVKTIGSIQGIFTKGFSGGGTISKFLFGNQKSATKTIKSLSDLKEATDALGNNIRTKVLKVVKPLGDNLSKQVFKVFKIIGDKLGSRTIKAVGLSIGKGIKGLSKTFLAAGTLGLSQVVFAGIDAIFGAVSGFKKTGERFSGVLASMGKNTEEATWGMYASSTAAGALVGVLNGLTFGLLGLFGVTEFLEQALSFIFYSIFSFVEGIVDGVMVAFDMVRPAFKFLYDQFASIGSSILEIFNAIFGIFGAGEVSGISGAFSILYKVLKSIGYVIGAIVGVPLGAVLWAATKIISFFVTGIQALINTVLGVINIFKGFIQFFIDIFTVGFFQAFKNLGSTILKAVYGVFKPTIDFIWSLVYDITYPFRWLWNVLVGNSIIPDMVTDIINWFAMLPIQIFKMLLRIPIIFGKIITALPNLIIKAFLKVPQMIGDMFSGIGSYLQSFGTDSLFGSIFSQLGNFYKFIGQTISNIVGFFSGLLDVFTGILTFDVEKIWGGIKTVFNSVFNQILNVGTFLYNGIMTGLKMIFVQIPMLVGKVLMAIPMLTMQALSWIGSAILSSLKSVFVDLPNYIWNSFMSLASNDWFGPIFEPFLAILSPVKDALAELYNAFASLGEAFSEIGNVFYEIFTVIADVFSSIFSTISSIFAPLFSLFGGVESSAKKTFGVMDILKGVIWGISKVIGTFLKVALFPLQLIFQGLARAIKSVATVIKGIADIIMGIFTLDASKIWQGISSIGGLIISNLKATFVDMPMWLGGMLMSGLKAIFIDLPMWLGGMIVSGLKAIFIDLPMWLGETIISGLKAVFIDLPMWLGKTISEGLASMMSSIPGAMYSALYGAASKVGMGWLVERLTGGKGAKETKVAESTNAVKGSPAKDSFSSPEKTLGSGALKTTSEKAISQRNESKQADALYKNSRALSEFVDASTTKGIIVGNDSSSTSATVSSLPPAASIGSNMNNIQSRVQKEKASSSLKKSEVISPELSEIASKAEEQNKILTEMKLLLERFVDLAKPEPEISGSSVSSEMGASGLPVVQKPTNYYRRVFGNMSSTPGKSIVNVGAKALS
jgi:phage-related protein